MADVYGNAIRRFVLQVGVWTPIVAPIACNYYAITNADGTAFLRSTDAANANAEYQVNAGMWDNIAAPYVPGHARWPAGAIVCYVMPLAGVGPAIVEFIQ